jgi:DNA polymerase III subunit epsilon
MTTTCASQPIRTQAELDAMAVALEASGDYRVLRKLRPRTTILPSDGSPTRRGLFIDVETTGLDATRDEIIELAMVPFTYGLDGRIFEIQSPFHRFREPTNPIPPEITAITGITSEMVAGKTIDIAEVTAFAAGSALVVAHNAAFDRRFLERLSDTFSVLPWACSMTQIDWAAQGYEGTKLAYLAGAAGFFYDRHRATNDCLAAIELLAAPLPTSGAPAMAHLLEQARRPSWRVWAENSPFNLKDVLKARGYRWNADGNPSPRAWYIELEDNKLEPELAFLKAEIYQREVDLLVERLTAYNRFTDRRN